jgi:hypothetical protein
MKNKYIAVLGLLQFFAISYSILFVYVIHRAVDRGYGVDRGFPMPAVFNQAGAFGKYGYLLYSTVLIWVFCAAILESGQTRFQPRTTVLISSGILILLAFVLLGVMFTLFAWTPMISLG